MSSISSLPEQEDKIIAKNDWLAITDVSDTTQSAYGSSRKIKAQSVVPGLDYYYPDYTEVDQGVVGGGNTIKSFVDAYGSENTIIVLRHNSGSETTTYTVNTLIIPYGVILRVEFGAVLDVVGTLTINGVLEAGTYQIFSGSGDVNGLNYACPDWWETNTTPGITDMTDAIQNAIDSTDESGVVKCHTFIYYYSSDLHFPRQKSVDLNHAKFITDTSSSIYIGTDESGSDIYIKPGYLINGTIEHTGGYSGVGVILGDKTKDDPDELIAFGYNIDNIRITGFDVGLQSNGRLWSCNISNSQFQSNNIGIYLNFSDKRGTGANIVFSNCNSFNNREIGVKLEGGTADGTDIIFSGCDIENNGIDTPTANLYSNSTGTTYAGLDITLLGCHIETGSTANTPCIYNKGCNIKVFGGWIGGFSGGSAVNLIQLIENTGGAELGSDTRLLINGTRIFGTDASYIVESFSDNVKKCYTILENITFSTSGGSLFDELCSNYSVLNCYGFDNIINNTSNNNVFKNKVILHSSLETDSSGVFYTRAKRTDGTTAYSLNTLSTHNDTTEQEALKLVRGNSSTSLGVRVVLSSLGVDTNTVGIATNANTPSGATSHALKLYDENGSTLGYIPVYGASW